MIAALICRLGIPGPPCSGRSETISFCGGLAPAESTGPQIDAGSASIAVFFCEAAASETPLVPATAIHTAALPAITRPGVFPIGIVSVTRLVRGSIRERVPVSPLVTQMAPAP